MIAITPSGTRMRPTWMPEGRYASEVISPTGSGSFATSRSPADIASIPFAGSARRSMKASSRPSERAAFTSCALAARIAFSRSARDSAAASSARFFAEVVARASARLATRADSPMACTMARTSAEAFRSLGMSSSSGHFLENRPPRESQRQLHDAVPRVGGLYAFNHEVDPVGPQEFTVEGRRAVPPGGAVQGFEAIGRQESPRALPRGERHQQAQLLAERPEQEGKRLALRLERGHHAHDARGVVGVDGFDERVALETRHVGHRFANRRERDRAARQQEVQLLDLLLGGEEIALDAIGQPFERLDRGALLLAREALRQPVGKLVARDRFRLDHGAAALECREPLRLEVLPVELGKHHKADGVSSKTRAPRLDRARALGAGLPRRDAKLHEALRGEEREGGARGEKAVPIHARLGEEHLALRAARFACGLADAVGRLECQQRLGAMHDIERAEPLLQVRLELARSDLHRQSSRFAAAMWRRIWRARASSLSLERSCD